MSEWGWTIAAVILVFTLVQLLAYYYLTRGDSGPEVWPSSTDGAGPRATAPGTHGESPFDEYGTDADLRRCSKCGAPNENEPIYTFCRNCGSELS